MRHRTVRGTCMKDEISWGSPVTKLEAFRCQKPPRNRKKRMDCMPWHIGCASLEQASTNESQLQVTSDREPQHPGQSVCWVSQAWWFSSLVFLHSKKCRPALPWLKACTSCALSSCVRRNSSVARETGIGRDLPAKKPALTRKTHVTSCWLRTSPMACPKTKQWGKIGNQFQNYSETIPHTKEGFSPQLSQFRSLI